MLPASSFLAGILSDGGNQFYGWTPPNKLVDMFSRVLMSISGHSHPSWPNHLGFESRGMSFRNQFPGQGVSQKYCCWASTWRHGASRGKFGYVSRYGVGGSRNSLLACLFSLGPKRQSAHTASRSRCWMAGFEGYSFRRNGTM